MRHSIPTDELDALAHATPEQQAAFRRMFGLPPVSADAGVAVAAAHSLVPARNVFRQAGSHWEARFGGGAVFHLEDTLGARYLAYLLHHPGVFISAFDLEVAICPDKAQARTRDSIQRQLDPDAVRNYLRELTRLRIERETAAEDGDAAGVERLDDEIAAVESALRASGPNGGDAGERARQNVTQTIARVLRRLARGNQAQKEFGEHLRLFVSTGYECGYRQPRSVVWEN